MRGRPSLMPLPGELRPCRLAPFGCGGYCVLELGEGPGAPLPRSRHHDAPLLAGGVDISIAGGGVDLRLVGNILRRGREPEVVDVHARAIPARVVDQRAPGDRPVLALVGTTVRGRLLDSPGDGAAAATGRVSRPTDSAPSVSHRCA